jgi:hypothetical protein
MGGLSTHTERQEDVARQKSFLERFQRFLGLEHEGRIPDAKTIWKFRQRLGPEGMEAVFLAFDGLLREKNLLTTRGTIADASFVELPQQHLTKEEVEDAKEGKANPEWSEHERRHMRNRRSEPAPPSKSV